MSIGNSGEPIQAKVGDYVKLGEAADQSQPVADGEGILAGRRVQIEVDPNFIGVKASSNKHSEDFIPVPKKTRVVRLPKKVRLLIKKIKQSAVAKKIAHLVRGKAKRAAKSENWAPIPETRLKAIVKKLSPQVQDEMKGKLREFNAMLQELDDKKQEIRRRETNCFKTEVEFSEAMDMVTATSKGNPIPHKKGLIVAFPASIDGQQKIYYQLNAGSTAGNIKDANIIREKFESHPIYDDYLRDRKEIKALTRKRNQIKKAVDKLEKEIQHLYKSDAGDRLEIGKRNATDRTENAKTAKGTELADQAMEETMLLRKDISSALEVVFGFEQQVADLDKDVERLNGLAKLARDDLGKLNKSIAAVEKARNNSSEDDQSEVDEKILNEWYGRREKLENVIQSHEVDLEARLLERGEIKVRMDEEKKVLREMEAKREARFDKVKSDSAKARKKMDKELKTDIKGYKAAIKDEVSDVKKVVTGRPKKPKSNLDPVGDLEKLQRVNRTEEEDLDALRKWGGVEE